MQKNTEINSPVTPNSAAESHVSKNYGFKMLLDYLSGAGVKHQPPKPRFNILYALCSHKQRKERDCQELLLHMGTTPLILVSGNPPEHFHEGCQNFQVSETRKTGGNVAPHTMRE